MEAPWRVPVAGLHRIWVTQCSDARGRGLARVPARPQVMARHLPVSGSSHGAVGSHAVAFSRRRNTAPDDTGRARVVERRGAAEQPHPSTPDIHSKLRAAPDAPRPLVWRCPRRARAISAADRSGQALTQELPRGHPASSRLSVSSASPRVLPARCALDPGPQARPIYGLRKIADGCRHRRIRRKVDEPVSVADGCDPTLDAEQLEVWRTDRS